MQDAYVGDIGDYGKYGLLRSLSDVGLKLFINWFRTCSASKNDDGRFINYLDIKNAAKYENYDKTLYHKLRAIVGKNRKLEEIEKSQLIAAKFYNAPVCAGNDRLLWHRSSLNCAQDCNVAFLDPDNGIETSNMIGRKKSIKHVSWPEIADYYSCRSVVVYQHQPRIKSENFINNILELQHKYINADHIRIVKYSSFASRFYIMFIHEAHNHLFDMALNRIMNIIPKFCVDVPISD